MKREKKEKRVKEILTKDNSLRSVAKIGRVLENTKTIQIRVDTLVGLRMWRKIDFLTHYLGWTLVWIDDEKSKAKKKAAALAA